MYILRARDDRPPRFEFPSEYTRVLSTCIHKYIVERAFVLKWNLRGWQTELFFSSVFLVIWLLYRPTDRPNHPAGFPPFFVVRIHGFNDNEFDVFNVVVHALRRYIIERNRLPQWYAIVVIKFLFSENIKPFG